MLGVGGVAPPSTPPPVVLKRTSGTTGKSTVWSLPLQYQTLKPNISLFPVYNYTQLFQRRNGFCLFAQKKQQGSSLGSVELEKETEFVDDKGFVVPYEFDDEGFEVDDEFDFEDEDFNDEEGGDEDDEVEEGDLLLPFEKMKEWLKNKPQGFGEGKVYDTSIEDKLMEEIEQSRKAQLANLKKLKNESKEANSKKEVREFKASEVVSNEIRVRINNLPKKMNVHRDLRSALQGVRGTVNIEPVVYGNKKTRDPICKGFGFVDFKSVEDANRFVQTFSGQSVAFGKMQKRIKCEILKSPNGGGKGLVQQGHRSTSKPRIAASEDEVDQNLAIQETDPPLQFWEDNDFDGDFDYEDDADDFESVRAAEQGDNDVMGSELKVGLDSSSLKQKRKAKGEKKKSVIDRKLDKIPQPSIPGSSMRLKLRERADLAEVFSRHGVNFEESMASVEKSRASVDIGDEHSEFDIEETDPSLEILEGADFYEDDEEPYDEDDAENIELVKASEQEVENRSELNKTSAPSSISSVHNEKTKADVKKSEVEEKPNEVPVILSAQELGELFRIRDPAVLKEFISRMMELREKASGDEEPDIEPLLEFLAEEAPEELDAQLPDPKVLEKLKVVDSDDVKTLLAMVSSASSSSSSAKQKEKKVKETKKVSAVKVKASKAPKLKVPGSAQRLKSRDKAKLTDVFTKYGTNETLASKEM